MTAAVGSAPMPVQEIGYTVDGATWWLAAEHERTPELRWPHSVEVYDQMRRQDTQVVSVLRAVTLPIRRTAWRIEPAGARDEVVQLVAEDLGLPIVGQDRGEQPRPRRRARGRFSFAEHLELALLMLPFGHSFFEQVYRIDTAGRARLRKLGHRPSRTLSEITVASDGGLVSITQHGRTGATGRPIPVEHLVAYVTEREGGNWLGRSLLRACYKNWLLKDRLLRVQTMTVERNGLGIPVYTGAPGETDLSAGKKIARSVRAGETAGAAVPHEAKLELIGVQGALPDATRPIEYHDAQIARGVLAHFLNLGTQTGSWALGTTFADFFVLALQATAAAVADVGTQHVIEDLLDLNWGEDEPAPALVFDEIGSQQPATAQALKMLFDAGAIFPDRELEQALRQQYGLPPKAPLTGGDLLAPVDPPAPPVGSS